MKASTTILSFIIIVLLIGVGVVYGWRDRLLSRSNLSASLPVADNVPEAVNSPPENTDQEPIIVRDESAIDSNNTVKPAAAVDGTTTQPAVKDGVVEGTTEEKIDASSSVPPTAQTGAGMTVWLIIGASLLTGWMGLMFLLARAVVARR